MNRLLAIREPTKWIDHGGYVTSRRSAPRRIADGNSLRRGYLLRGILATTYTCIVWQVKKGLFTATGNPVTGYRSQLLHAVV